MLVGFLLAGSGLLPISAGFAPTIHFRGLLKLRRVMACRLLIGPGSALSQGSDPASCLIEPLVSYYVLPTTTWVGLSHISDLRLLGPTEISGLADAWFLTTIIALSA